MGKELKENEIPELSWTKSDYQTAGVEIPDSLLEDNIHTEGELMNEADILEWVSDTQKTFIIIRQENKEIFEKLYQKYIIDIHYLYELGKITKETEEELIDQNLFEI
jgi:hypothetical protein